MSIFSIMFATLPLRLSDPKGLLTNKLYLVPALWVNWLTSNLFYKISSLRNLLTLDGAPIERH